MMTNPIRDFAKHEQNIKRRTEPALCVMTSLADVQDPEKGREKFSIFFKV
jgi:hypothetical protein